MANDDNWWEYPDQGTQVPNPADNSGWEPNDPYNQAPAPPPAGGTQSEGSCPPGMEKSPFDSAGNDAPYPLECVSTSEAQRRFDLRKAKNSAAGAASGGAGSSGGGGVPLPAGGPGWSAVPFGPEQKYQPEPQDKTLDYEVMKGIQDALSGNLLPFGTEQMAAAKASGLQASQGRAAVAKGNLERDLLRRGLTRSGIAAEGNMAIDRQAGADYTANLRDTVQKAAVANYQAKVDALKRAQDYLDQRKQFALANIRTSLDYQIANAQNNLAYARLQQEWAALQKQLANALNIARMGNQTQLIALMGQYGNQQSF